MEILIGADPELFVKDKDGKYVSAHGLVSGTKKNPLAVDKGAVQVDGMALEFNIDPAKTAAEFTGNISAVLARLNSMIPGNLTFAFDPVANFGKELIDAQPNEAKELGCDPDFNAYTDGQPNPRPNASADFRTASGHIHIGWTKGEDINNPEHLEACMMVTKQLDAMLGVAEQAWCPPNRRKELYGQLGTFRPKSYGVEYRVLSNAWLRSEKLQKLVFEAAKSAVNSLYNGKKYYNDKSALTYYASESYQYDWYQSYLYPVVTKVFGPEISKRVTNDMYHNLYERKERTFYLS